MRVSSALRPAKRRRPARPGDRLTWLLLLAFALIILRLGWIAEDMYISLRTIENLLAGDGLVWNVGERVQAFTHPLWLFVCAGVRGITGEHFFSLIVCGAAVSFVALALVGLRLARTAQVGIVLVLAATLSHAFVDYSTSGLENPLTHLLLALAAWVYLGQLPSAKTFGELCLIGGLSLLSRPDNAVLLGPVVLAAGVQARQRGASWSALARALGWGSVPLVAWELFSLVYYGSLVPNTAIAKLNTGIDPAELRVQGFMYLISTLDKDPLTLLVIVAGVVAPFVTRDRRLWPLAFGVVLHLVYVVKIGGDYMLGRFLTAPMFLAMICLARVRKLRLVEYATAAAVVVGIGLSADPSTLVLNGDDGLTMNEARHPRRVHDIHRMLWDSASLLAATRTRQMPDHRWADLGRKGPRRPGKVEVVTAVGMRAYHAEREVHWIDNVALGDPLLARLPARHDAEWMPGHFFREVPKGYRETIETGENLIADAQVRQLYDKVHLVTHGDLFSVERFKAIWWLNNGGPQRLLDEERWRYAGASKRTPASLARQRVPDGTPLGSKRVRAFPRTGVDVRYKDRQHRRVLEVSLNDADRFELRFYDGDEEIARVPVDVKLTWHEPGVTARKLALPEIVQDRGFTRYRILPRTQKRRQQPYFAIGHVLFDEAIDDVPAM